VRRDTVSVISRLRLDMLVPIRGTGVGVDVDVEDMFICIPTLHPGKQHRNES
jgi:hypothetical protein